MANALDAEIKEVNIQLDKIASKEAFSKIENELNKISDTDFKLFLTDEGYILDLISSWYNINEWMSMVNSVDDNTMQEKISNQAVKLREKMAKYFKDNYKCKYLYYKEEQHFKQFNMNVNWAIYMIWSV